jgi:D-beta-D-heptose 7-phosphate kinase/D-beta-D-heptose 1-phosphate adenosyltransferase
MENISNAIALIEAGSNSNHLLVVGDVMLDKYIHGAVERISPEAPVPVVLALRKSQSAGGAANVAMNIVGLNGGATLIAFAADDEDDVHLRQCLVHPNLKAVLTSIPGTSTTSKLRILAGSQQMIRLDVEFTGPHPADAYVALLQCVGQALPHVGGVILSDYAKGVLTEEVCRSVISSARTRGIPVFVDPKNADFSRYKGATAICPNLKELTLAAGRSSADLEALLDRGQEMVTELGLEYMVVTMGERGIMILHEDRRSYLPSVAKQVFDVSGAGDTVIAMLALAISCGVTVEDAAQMANVAAGIVIGKQGTVPITLEELIPALKPLSYYRGSVLQEAD